MHKNKILIVKELKSDNTTLSDKFYKSISSFFSKNSVEIVENLPENLKEYNVIIVHGDRDINNKELDKDSYTIGIDVKNETNYDVIINNTSTSLFAHYTLTPKMKKVLEIVSKKF